MFVGYLVLFLTLAWFAVVGFRADRGSTDLDRYVTARGTQGSLSLGLSFFASGVGAWILFTPPEVGAFVGLVAVLGYAVGAAAPFVVFALLGRRLRRVVPGGHALTEFVRLRFGRVLHAYVVAISILYMLVFVTAELTAVGTVGAITADLSPTTVIVATAVVTVAYTTYAGLAASLRTDAWQAWLVLVLLAVGVVAALAALPAPAEAFRGSGLLGVEGIGVRAAVTLVIAVTAANLFHQGYWQRVFAARDLPALTRGAGIGVATTLPVLAVAGLLGIVASGAGLDLGQPPAPLFALTAGLPTWVAIVVLALGVSLVASSVDTLENALASLVVAERPSLSLRAGRLVTVVLLVPALAVAIVSVTRPELGLTVLRLFLIADLLCAATVVPALSGLTSWATAGGALAGAIAGLVGAVAPGWWSTGSLARGTALATFPDGVPTLDPFAGALLASLVVTVVGSLASRRRTDLSEFEDRVPVLEHSPR